MPVSTEFLRATKDGYALVIRVTYPDLCQELLGVHVDESPTSVRIVAVASRPEAVCPMRALSGELEVALESPLGDRTVISE